MQTELRKILDPLESIYGWESSLQLMDMFFAQAPEMIDKIERALASHDSSELAAAAHSMHGNISALGLAALEKNAKTIEGNAGDFIVCTSELADIRAELDRLRGLFKGLVGSADNGSSQSGKIKLAVVEDSGVTRKAIVCILEQFSDFEIVGDCEDGLESLTMVDEAKPDLVLFDIELPGINGIEAVQIIKERSPEIKAVMLTSHDSDEKLFASFAAGAEGYLLKSNFNKNQLEMAIRTVASGNCWLDPVLAQRVLQAAERSKKEHIDNVLTSADEDLLHKVANPSDSCRNGVCEIDSAFLSRLQRLNPKNLKN